MHHFIPTVQNISLNIETMICEFISSFDVLKA